MTDFYFIDTNKEIRRQKIERGADIERRLLELSQQPSLTADEAREQADLVVARDEIVHQLKALREVLAAADPEPTSEELIEQQAQAVADQIEIQARAAEILEERAKSPSQAKEVDSSATEQPVAPEPEPEPEPDPTPVVAPEPVAPDPVIFDPLISAPPTPEPEPELAPAPPTETDDPSTWEKVKTWLAN